MADSPTAPAPHRAGAPAASEELPEVLDVISRMPACAETPLGALDSAITPNERFFVRNHFAVPTVDRATWRLALSGEVRRPLDLSVEALRELPSRTVIATMECAGNSRRAVYPPAEGVQWNHGAVGTAEWEGVPLRELLERAGPLASAREVVLEGADRGREPGVEAELAYAMSLPLEKAMDADTLIATRMNGDPLSAQHGAPARAIVPGWYGMASVKWLTRIQVSSAPFLGHYRTKSYVFVPEGPDSSSPTVPVTRLRVKSLITWPTEGTLLPRGSYTIRGVAWSGEGPIERVELTTRAARSDRERGAWIAARLLENTSPHAWVRWECPVELRAAGHYVLRSRAIDRAGHTQPAQALWNFRGVATNSVHAVRITVRAT
ncbi:MAG: sulfite oxidase [Thermoplasmata archaeon]|nr:sulfite oxidase [Thermoplasmata archaeon]MCI4342370.1 sulfite oxidase [Thermoplasmata archaeon]